MVWVDLGGEGCPPKNLGHGVMGGTPHAPSMGEVPDTETGLTLGSEPQTPNVPGPLGHPMEARPHRPSRPVLHPFWEVGGWSSHVLRPCLPLDLGLTAHGTRSATLVCRVEEQPPPKALTHLGPLPSTRGPDLPGDCIACRPLFPPWS